MKARVTYEIKMAGKTISGRLSPHAIASMVSWLQVAHTNAPDVDQELDGLCEKLATLLGDKNLNRLVDELGL